MFAFKAQQFDNRGYVEWCYKRLTKWDKSGVNVRANKINQVFMSGFLSGQFLVFAL